MYAFKCFKFVCQPTHSDTHTHTRTPARNAAETSDNPSMITNTQRPPESRAWDQLSFVSSQVECETRWGYLSAEFFLCVISWHSKRNEWEIEREGKTDCTVMGFKLPVNILSKMQQNKEVLLDRCKLVNQLYTWEKERKENMREISYVFLMGNQFLHFFISLQSEDWLGSNWNLMRHLRPYKVYKFWMRINRRVEVLTLY